MDGNTTLGSPELKEDGDTSHIEELLDSFDLAISRAYRVDPLRYAALLRHRQQFERRFDAITSEAPTTREHRETSRRPMPGGVTYG